MRDHRFTGLPSADIAPFHLSEEGQLLLLNSSPLGGSVQAEQGMEIQRSVIFMRSVDDFTGVFGHDSHVQTLPCCFSDGSQLAEK